MRVRAPATRFLFALGLMASASHAVRAQAPSATAGTDTATVADAAIDAPTLAAPAGGYQAPAQALLRARGLSTPPQALGAATVPVAQRAATAEGGASTPAAQASPGSERLPWLAPAPQPYAPATSSTSPGSEPMASDPPARSAPVATAPVATAPAAAETAVSTAAGAAPGPLGCPAGGGRLPVSRVVSIDAASGPIYGDITRRAKEPNFLRPKEVVLTFDDGPMPWITRSVLDTLDRYCAKATFFEVGRMAVAYPGMVREVLARGHTIGGHTWSHPFNLPHMKPEKAHEEIEKGLSAISLAAGQPVAPFFRFTGLGDSDPLLAYLQKRGIASFTVDVVSDDSYINDATKLANITLQRIEAKGGGIVLFHDIKAATAKALPVILAGLADRGYRVVHMAATRPVQPLDTWNEALAPTVAKTLPKKGEKAPLLPFYGAIGPQRAPEMTALAPEPRTRSTVPPAARAAMGPRQRAAMSRPTRGMVVASPAQASGGGASGSGGGGSTGGGTNWATEIRPMPRGTLPPW